MRSKLSELHQKRIANCAVGASSFRNQGKPGLIHAAHIFLGELDLNEFVKSLNSNNFDAYLNKVTNSFLKSLSRHNCKWGTARKGLNLFLRDIFYSRYFYEELGLKKQHGNQLEIPLDKYTGNGIKDDIDRLDPELGSKVPRWGSIVSLTAVDSALYQNAAKRLIKVEYPHLTRVDLDLELWRR